MTPNEVPPSVVPQSVVKDIIDCEEEKFWKFGEKKT